MQNFALMLNFQVQHSPTQQSHKKNIKNSNKCQIDWIWMKINDSDSNIIVEYDFDAHLSPKG